MKKKSEFANSESFIGEFTTSEHLIFTEVNDLIESKMYVKSGSIYYKIDNVIKNPAGISDNHYQLYCTRVNGITDD